MNLVVIFICFLTSLGITEGPVTVCTDGSKDPNVELSCNSSEMIHVESITHYNGSNCSQALIDKTVCGPPLTGTSSGLNTVCNGQITSCNETLYTRTGCQAARVDYRCIQDTEVHDMCGDLNKNFTNNFFLSTGVSLYRTSAPCTCSIRGSAITSINILELQFFTVNVRTRSNLLIYYGDKIYNKTGCEVCFRDSVFNDYLTTTDLTSFTVQLNHKNHLVTLWMEIQGGDMVVNCSRNGTISLTPETTTSAIVLTSTQQQTSPSTTTTSSSTTTTSPSTETDKQSDLSSTNIILIVLSSLSLLVIVGMFLVILILCRRGKETDQQKGDGREVTREGGRGGRLGGQQDGRNVTTESDRNNYSQLNHSALEPVTDELYLEPRDMNSTPEYDYIGNTNYVTVM